MSETILVPIKGRGEIEQIVPYLEKITRPGTRVVFLIRYPADGLNWLAAYSGTMETGVQEVLMANTVSERLAWEEQKRLAEERVFQACKRLRKGGADVDVHVYTGSLRKTLTDRAVYGNSSLILIPAKDGRLRSLLRGVIGLFSTFKKPAPAGLLHFTRAV